MDKKMNRHKISKSFSISIVWWETVSSRKSFCYKKIHLLYGADIPLNEEAQTNIGEAQLRHILYIKDYLHFTFHPSQ